ncbi:BAG family molecular chaperone regulator 7-like [Salvia miltiorrhiza]|uniref:BAG family molecular chaperone regulator 7-like n=1 Tax=Salvia miltiorrhiza TaxID=226208 RepID=UPI0025AD70C6|nr:BAG family molecular chaperone regulator 7-like [Salvia miltiorrhiza]
MSRLRRFEIVEHQPSPSYFLKQTSIFDSPRALRLNKWFPIVEQELDLLAFAPTPPLLLHDFEAVADLIQIHRTSRFPDPYLQTLSDRVSALELGLDRLAKEEERERDSKYSWTAEIKSPDDGRKYKWTAEKKGLARSYKVTAEIKKKGAVEQTYTFKVSSGDSQSVVGKTEKKKKCEKVKEKGKKSVVSRIVEVEEPSYHGGIVLRQAFSKTVDKRRGKRKELSPQEAATLIQKSFRAYLIQRSQSLRALRELAIAKTKLKEIRSLFNNFSYRRRLARNAEELQRFSEKIIVLLLTVDAIEGGDIMVRAAKKSMVDELEAMLDVVDPQPSGKSSSMKRRTFDMPDGAINKELAAGVAQVVRMLDEEAASSEAFEACL